MTNVISLDAHRPTLDLVCDNCDQGFTAKYFGDNREYVCPHCEAKVNWPPESDPAA